MTSGRNRKRLHRFSRRLARSRAGSLSVAGASFAEATVAPIPLEALLAPLMLLHRDRAWELAAMATAGCVAAAAVGYGVGWMFFDTAGRWLLETFEWGEAYATAQRWIESYGFWAVLVIGIAPIPFQTAMLVAGATGMTFPVFLAASALSRGIRYFGLAVIVLVLPRAWGGGKSTAE